MAHYNTAAQMNAKWDDTDTAPVASSGAFGYYGNRPAASNNGIMVNFPSTNTIEISAYAICGAQFGQWLYLRNGSGNQTAFFMYSDGHIHANNGIVTAFGDSAAAAFSFGVQHHVYIKCVSHLSAGTILIKIDGVEVLNLSGLNTAPQGTPGYTQVAFFGQGNSSIADCIWSHVALGNASGDITGRPRVQAVFPDASGNYSQWNRLSGAANYEMIDEQFPDDDTTYVYESTVNDRDSYTYSNFLSTTDTVVAVAIVPLARTDDAASRTMKTFVRAGGTDYDHPDTVSVPGSYGYLQQIYVTNPATGVAWTPAEVNAIEAGIKVVS